MTLGRPTRSDRTAKLPDLVAMQTTRALFALAFMVCGAVVGFGQPREPVDGLELGVRFVEEGDFETAAEVLEAVTLILEGQRVRRPELARAYLYLGYALLYTDGEEAAKKRFYEAQLRDPRLFPSATQFPRRVIRLWNATGSGDATRPTPQPRPAATRETGLGSDSPDARGAPIDPSVWLSSSADRLLLKLALARPRAHCVGEMLVDKARERLSWSTSDADGACPTVITVPSFDHVESVGAAEEGGFVVQVSSGDERRLVFIPQPFGAWFDAGTQGLSHLDLPSEDTVATRLAVRELLKALGRPPSGAWSYYGTPVEISAAELLNTPAGYDGRAVRTRGRFTSVGSPNNRTYSLVAPGAVIGLSPTPETQALIDANAATLNGTEITVTGVFRRRPVSANQRGDDSRPYSISFWSASSAVLAATNRASQTLRDLFTATPVPTDQPVAVIGQFRGSNLFGDVPPRTRLGRRVDDWILRDGTSSIWVTGRRPEGDGWSLDLWNMRDTSTWLRVSGRVVQDDGNYYLIASEVAPAQRQPSQTAASPSVLGWQPVPPDVQFTLPLEFEEARPDSQFVIQFTKPIDPGTFEGNVVLRYAGPAAPDDPGFTSVSFQYSEERRSLHVDPGTALQSGRALEILLRPGISDFAGMALDGVKTLTWQVGR